MQLITPAYNRLGWSQDIQNPNEIILQTNVLKRMCSWGLEECVNQTMEFYYNWADLNET